LRNALPEKFVFVLRTSEPVSRASSTLPSEIRAVARVILKGIFALQDEVALSILTAVRRTLTYGEHAHITASGASNIETYFKLLEALAMGEDTGHTGLAGR